VIRLAGALRLGCDSALSAASLVADRLIGMAGMAMSMPFGLPSFLQIKNFGDIITGGIPLILGGVVSSEEQGRFQKLWGSFRNITRRMLEALSIWMKQPGALLLALAATWVHMLCFFGVLELLFSGMGDHIPYWLIGGLYSVVYFVTLIPISINGYGVQEI
jgi:hypothetical protein